MKCDREIGVRKMKRKLKPLHQILKENPDYYFDEDGNLEVQTGFISRNTLRLFGKEVEIKSNNIKYNPTWLEPLPEKKKVYCYINRDGSYMWSTYEKPEAFNRCPEFDIEAKEL